MDIVIYHANCNDGFCGAWLAHWAWPDAEFIPAQHGTPPPDVAGKRVLMVDFTYKRPVMLDLLGKADHITILDHHKTAEKDLDGLAFSGPPRRAETVVFDMTKSGGRLMWEHINRHNAYLSELPDCPWIVDYTEDRDLWRWALPDSREINAALASYPMTFDEWDRLAVLGYEPLIPEGRAILRYQSKVVDDHVCKARMIDLAGHRVPAVNATVLFSEIAGKLAEDAPFGVVYFLRDGKWQYSLRSRGEGGVDVSEIARQFNGGGHRNAAGFEFPGNVDSPPC